MIGKYFVPSDVLGNVRTLSDSYCVGRFNVNFIVVVIHETLGYAPREGAEGNN